MRSSAYYINDIVVVLKAQRRSTRGDSATPTDDSFVSGTYPRDRCVHVHALNSA
jgi:hypothetical protein